MCNNFIKINAFKVVFDLFKKLTWNAVKTKKKPSTKSNETLIFIVSKNLLDLKINHLITFYLGLLRKLSLLFVSTHVKAKNIRGKYIFLVSQVLFGVYACREINKVITVILDVKKVLNLGANLFT